MCFLKEETEEGAETLVMLLQTFITLDRSDKGKGKEDPNISSQKKPLSQTDRGPSNEVFVHHLLRWSMVHQSHPCRRWHHRWRHIVVWKWEFGVSRPSYILRWWCSWCPSIGEWRRWHLGYHQYVESIRIQMIDMGGCLAIQIRMDWQFWLVWRNRRKSMILQWSRSCNRNQSWQHCIVDVAIERHHSCFVLVRRCWQNRHQLSSCFEIVCSEQRT